MKTYIGTKLVNMKPMTRAVYNVFRGWTLPADEDGADAGYLVEYLDGDKPNTEHFAGYVSWSPAAQAEAAYRETSGLTFGLAIEALKLGKKVARAGWNGKGMFVYLVPAASYPATTDAAKVQFASGMVPYNAYLALKGVDDTVSTWVPSINDVLAEDWVITP
jgi:hypothetical protein